MTVLHKKGIEGGESISLTIIEEIASKEDRDPMDLPPLHDAVETDALDSLFGSHDNGGLLVEFTYHGYRVTVGGETQIRVESL